MANRSGYDLTPVKVVDSEVSGDPYELTAIMSLYDPKPGKDVWHVVVRLNGVLIGSTKLEVAVGTKPPFDRASAWTKQRAEKKIGAVRKPTFKGNFRWR